MVQLANYMLMTFFIKNMKTFYAKSLRHYIGFNSRSYYSFMFQGEIMRYGRWQRKVNNRWMC